MSKFNTTEVQALESFISDNPTLKVRAAARQLYTQAGNVGSTHPLYHRTQAAIYGKLRTMIGDLKPVAGTN